MERIVAFKHPIEAQKGQTLAIIGSCMGAQEGLPRQLCLFPSQANRSLKGSICPSPAPISLQVEFLFLFPPYSLAPSTGRVPPRTGSQTGAADLMRLPSHRSASALRKTE